ncbi:hypothetical protein MMC17_006624 [Xylographa soralifera]|nr:hypothetical protein [Xylographa soralifera]
MVQTAGLPKPNVQKWKGNGKEKQENKPKTLLLLRGTRYLPQKGGSLPTGRAKKVSGVLGRRRLIEARASPSPVPQMKSKKYVVSKTTWVYTYDPYLCGFGMKQS